ncbi:MAG: hypothetical protein J6X81_03075 [Muribaculaceae bacterium]|nr:hypothetical protein [Muribaculaceae bacterium]
MLQEVPFMDEASIQAEALDKMSLNYFEGFASPQPYMCYITADKVYFVPEIKITGKPIMAIDLADIEGYKKGFALRFHILLKDGTKVLLSLWKKSKLIEMIDKHRFA